MEDLFASLREEALKLGFSDIKIKRVEDVEKPLRDNSYRLIKWLRNGYAGEMSYMKRNIKMRVSPRELMPTAKYIIVFLTPYNQKRLEFEQGCNVSVYAYGTDYHYVLKELMIEFLSELKKRCTVRDYKLVVDSVPLWEKAIAHIVGLGWIGRNSLLINKDSGSMNFISTILVDMDIDKEEDMDIYGDKLAFLNVEALPKNLCGSCSRCVDACPTGAILPLGKIDGTKCISYLTIEKRGSFLKEDLNMLSGWLFGCDICSDICPWNSKALPTSVKDFLPKETSMGRVNKNREGWFTLSSGEFKREFKSSPLWRGGIRKIKEILF